MYRLGRTIPAGMVSITRVSASVYALIFQFLNFLILQTLFDLEQLLRRVVWLGVANDTNAAVPGRLLSAEEVSIHLMLHCLHSAFNLGVLRVSVLVPPGKASLLPSVVVLAVMD